MCDLFFSLTKIGLLSWCMLFILLVSVSLGENFRQPTAFFFRLCCMYFVVAALIVILFPSSCTLWPMTMSFLFLTSYLCMVVTSFIVAGGQLRIAVLKLLCQRWMYEVHDVPIAPPKYQKGTFLRHIRASSLWWRCNLCMELVPVLENDQMFRQLYQHHRECFKKKGCISKIRKLFFSLIKA